MQRQTPECAPHSSTRAPRRATRVALVAHSSYLALLRKTSAAARSCRVIPKYHLRATARPGPRRLNSYGDTVRTPRRRCAALLHARGVLPFNAASLRFVATTPSQGPCPVLLCSGF